MLGQLGDRTMSGPLCLSGIRRMEWKGFVMQFTSCTYTISLEQDTAVLQLLVQVAKVLRVEHI